MRAQLGLFVLTCLLLGSSVIGQQGPNTFGVEMMDTIALAPNHPASRLVVRSTMAMEEIGFAIAGSGELGRFVRPGPDESRRVLKQVAYRLEQVERTALAEWYRERKESDPADEQVTLTRTYRGTFRGPDFDLMRPERSMNGRFHYFLSGERLFLLGLKSEPGCKLNVSFNGVGVGTVDGKVKSSPLHADPYDGFAATGVSWSHRWLCFG